MRVGGLTGEGWESVEVLIIGAGPAGAVPAALLRQQGQQVLVLERERFPRFSIGESLLPQSMEYLEQGGMLRAVVEAGFQLKNGAAFAQGEQYTEFDFGEKYSHGWSTTYQVPRARFILDASGFGGILPRLLQLETPSNFPVRGAIFTHIEDRITQSGFDRNKIRVTVHPEHTDVWFWLIPFAGGRCSVGVVTEPALLERYQGTDTQRLQALVSEDSALRNLLENACWDTPARRIVGYSANVKSLSGRGYALLGNAGEFLDPIFSSGVTIAFKSASLAAAILQRRFAGETVDWFGEYAVPLKKGVDTFRAFVESWYRGGFQRIIFHHNQQPEIRRMISAILAGYAWDESNPYVREPRRRLAALEELCS
jgi:flavin-dependent dehydrogenase